MNEDNVVELSGRVEAGDALTAMLRSGAQELIRQAVDAELQELLARDRHWPGDRKDPESAG